MTADPSDLDTSRSAASDGQRSRRQRRTPPVSRLWWLAGPLLAVLTTALVVMAIRPVEYYALLPGTARDVEPLISFRKGTGELPKVEPPDDDLLFVTVTIRRPFGLEVLARLRQDTAEVVPEDQIDGGQTREENRQFNLQLMTDSKDKAAKVALERAGYEVQVSPSGSVIVDLGPEYPVAKVAHPGETIVAVDGAAVTTTEEVRAAIAGHQPGEQMSLTLEALDSDQRHTVSVELIDSPTEPGKAFLGVSLQDRPSYQFPFQVDIDSQQVGGPSAGLAFTLAILDQLTAGDLTGDRKVAVTGTIELDGSVGPVGGVKQKTEAAVSQGATLFLVPPDELDDAKRAAKGRLTVRSVSSLDEALAALEAAGGDPVPAPAPAGDPGSS